MSSAFAGRTVAVSEVVCMTIISRTSLSSVMPDTGTLTVTRQVALLPPDEARMRHIPAPTALTTPSCVTVATDVSPESQVTVLSVAFSGSTVATSVTVLSTYIVISFLSRETLSTGILTVTSQFALLPPFAAVMLQVPAPTAVTVPSCATVATASLSLDQVTVLSVTSIGRTVAVSFSVSWIQRFSLVLLSTTPDDGMTTVTWQLALFSPAVAVTVQVPSATAVISPLADTRTILSLLLDQVTVLSEASSGRTVAIRERVSPLLTVISVSSSRTSSTRMIWSNSATFIMLLVPQE